MGNSSSKTADVRNVEFQYDHKALIRVNHSIHLEVALHDTNIKVTSHDRRGVSNHRNFDSLFTYNW